MGTLINPFRINWTPADIQSILSLWCDAADEDTITASAGAVSKWSDKSGNGNHLVQATGSQQPTTASRTIGGLNALDFDGTDDNFNLTSAIDVIGKEMWVVTLIDTTPPYRDVWFGNLSGNVQAGALDPDDMRIWAATNPYSADTRGPDLDENIEYVLGFLAHSDTKKFVKNGVLTTTTDTYVSGALSVNKVGRGQYNLLNGLIGEVIITNTALSTEVRQLLEGYLAWKWGGL